MDIVDIDAAMGAEHVPETGAVEHRARPDDTPAGPPGKRDREVGHHIDRVADDQDHGGRILSEDVRENAADRCRVFLHQRQAAFAGALRRTRRDTINSASA